MSEGLQACVRLRAESLTLEPSPCVIDLLWPPVFHRSADRRLRVSALGDPPISGGCGIHPHPRPRILAHQTIPSLGSLGFNPGSCAFPIGIRPRANESAQGLFPGRRVRHRGDGCAHLFTLIGRIGKAGDV